MKRNMYKNLFLTLFGVFFLTGCYTPSVTTKVDNFSGEKISLINETCGSGLCARFKIIGDKEAFMYIVYAADDWLFVNQVKMKIKGTDKSINLDGNFNREVLYGGKIRETLVVPVDNELYEFLQSSLGNTVLVRFNGEQYYKDWEVPVSTDPTKGQWALFLNNFKK